MTPSSPRHRPRPVSPAALVLFLLCSVAAAQVPEPAHWWRAEGNANDSVGSAHGTFNGSYVSPGLGGTQAFALDGTDSVELPPAIAPTEFGDFSLSMWVKMASLGSEMTLASDWDPSYTDPLRGGWRLLKRADDTVSVKSPWGEIRGPKVLEANRSYHVAMTWQAQYGGNLAIFTYVDGELQGSQVISPSVNPATDFRLFGDGGLPYLSGIGDEVRMWNLALTGDQVRAEYDAGPNGGTNQPPVANAGGDASLTVPEGTAVQLDGSGSSDPEGSTLDYAWMLVAPTGSTAALDNATAVAPKFTPDIDGEYVITLVVTDAGSESDTDTITLSIVIDERPIVHIAPVLAAEVGNDVSLDGSASTDVLTPPEDLDYLWTIQARPAGSLADFTSSPTESATSFVPDLPGPYVIRLTVTDGSMLTGVAEVTVTASLPNAAPHADAGPDQLVAIDTSVELDGSSSTDPDSDPLTYRWSIWAKPADSNAELQTDVQSPTAWLTPDVPGLYILELVVNDSQVDSFPDRVSIEAVHPTSLARVAVLTAADVVESLPLSSFYGGDPFRAKRAAVYRRQLLTDLRVAATLAGQLEVLSTTGRPTGGARRASLKALSRILSVTDGIPLRGTPDTYQPQSIYKRDTLIDPPAAQVVYDLITQARSLVVAMP